ncbi:hypothetical protein IC575_028544 [Cucumis melo]
MMVPKFKLHIRVYQEHFKKNPLTIKYPMLLAKVPLHFLTNPY